MSTNYNSPDRVDEILIIDDAVKALILKNAGEAELVQAAAASGMQTMYRDGMTKALAGETTVEEVLRVTREDG